MRSKFLNAPLSATLRETYAKKTVRVIKGDTVKVTRGDHVGEEGLVDGIDTRNLKIIVHGVSSTKVDGTEVPRPVDASKVEITRLKLDDKRRVEKLGGKE
jgi:large subunit ribosomal protein L24